MMMIMKVVVGMGLVYGPSVFFFVLFNIKQEHGKKTMFDRAQMWYVLQELQGEKDVREKGYDHKNLWEKEVQ